MKFESRVIRWWRQAKIIVGGLNEPERKSSIGYSGKTSATAADARHCSSSHQACLRFHLGSSDNAFMKAA